jgi:hypothetical protein
MAKKVILIVLGAVGILIGLGLLAGGGILVGLTGGDGYLDSGPHTLTTATRALVSEPQTIRNGSSFDEDGPDVKLRVQVTSTEPVFLGVGPAVEVDRYLEGVQIDEVVSIDFAPFSIQTNRREGERSPAAPTEQTFWSARAAGTGEQTLNWDARSGDYRFVLMKLDGAAGVRTSATFGIRIPFLRGLGIGLLSGGGLSLVVGVLFLIWGIRSKVTPRAPAYPGQFGPPGVYPPAGQYGQYPQYGPPGQYGQQPAGQYGQYPPAGQYPAQYPPGGQYGQYPPAGQPPEGQPGGQPTGGQSAAGQAAPDQPAPATPDWGQTGQPGESDRAAEERRDPT